jgi:hypothetical protein
MLQSFWVCNAKRFKRGIEVRNSVMLMQIGTLADLGYIHVYYGVLTGLQKTPIARKKNAKSEKDFRNADNN